MIAMSETRFEQFAPEEFPHDAAPEEKLRFLLSYAILAPSSHNTQPWLWEIAGDGIALRADFSRQMPALDPEGRELIMSCGAALEHLRIAMHAFGYEDETTLFPDRQQSDFVARVRLLDKRPTVSSEEELFRAIPKRHTNRSTFTEQSLPESLVKTMHADAGSAGAWLHFFTGDDERRDIAALIAVGSDVQACNYHVRWDMANWMSPNNGTRRDGIPGYAQGIGDGASHIAPFWMRIFGSHVSSADHNWMQADSAPALVALVTDGEGPIQWLAAGRALSRILLRAAAQGVSASFFSQPIQVDATWSELRRLLRTSDRDGFPQLIFRLGYAEEATLPTPRRDVEDVTSTPALSSEESPTS
jgi:hypothetical protein